MTAKTDLLPCPFCGAGKTEIREDRPWLGQRYGEPISVSVRHWCEPIEGQPVRMIERVGRDRAAAVAAWNRRAAARGAEIEALRAEVERLRTDGASAVRWAPGSAYWSEVLVELFGPDARKGIDVLEARWRKEIERAERLAEALRELEEREQRDEVLLRQALEALSRAHQTAMVQTLKTRIPECGAFGGIAQDLDFVVTTLRERLGEGAEP